MWDTKGLTVSMAEGDYGIILPVEIEIEGVTLGTLDSIKIVFRTSINGDLILEKNYDGIENNTVNLEFTEDESALFPVGSYVYGLDWYQSGNFMCNIITSSPFKVVDKA